METAGGVLTAKMQLLIWRPVQSAPWWFIYLCLRREAGLSAVSGLMAAELSVLPPVLLWLAEHPPETRTFRQGLGRAAGRGR